MHDDSEEEMDELDDQHSDAQSENGKPEAGASSEEDAKEGEEENKKETVKA